MGREIGQKAVINYNLYLTDLEIINAKYHTNYPLGTPLWYGVTDMDRDVANAATAKAINVIRNK